MGDGEAYDEGGGVEYGGGVAVVLLIDLNEVNGSFFL